MICGLGEVRGYKSEGRNKKSDHLKKNLTGGVSCKNLKKANFVIPTKVGIQSFPYIAKPLDSRFHGNDDFCKSLSVLYLNFDFLSVILIFAF